MVGSVLLVCAEFDRQYISLFRNGARSSHCGSSKHCSAKVETFFAPHSRRWQVIYSVDSNSISFTDQFLRFEAYGKAAALFTISQAYITDKNNAASQIDHVITDCITQVQPFFLFFRTISSQEFFRLVLYI